MAGARCTRICERRLVILAFAGAVLLTFQPDMQHGIVSAVRFHHTAVAVQLIVHGMSAQVSADALDNRTVVQCDDQSAA